jgi:beta-lactam-binding protein with PASTA domain
MNMKRNLLVLCLLMSMIFGGVSAQGSAVTVPDVTGMNAPQAAAALNAAGLLLGMRQTGLSPKPRS